MSGPLSHEHLRLLGDCQCVLPAVERRQTRMVHTRGYELCVWSSPVGPLGCILGGDILKEVVRLGHGGREDDGR